MKLESVAPAVGAEPVWMSGGGCWCGARPLKTAWIVDRRHEGTLEVSGSGGRPEEAVQFPGEVDAHAVRFVVHDAHQTSVLPGGIGPDEESRYAFHMGYVSYPRPGCYRLIATMAGRDIHIVVDQPRCPDCILPVAKPR